MVKKFRQSFSESQEFARYTLLILVALLVCFLVSTKVEASQQVILASAARTATTTSTAIYKSQEKIAHFIINVTVAPGAQTLTPEIDAQDTNGLWYPLLTGTAISTTGVTVLKVGPGIGAVSGGTAPDYLPDVYRVKLTHSSTGSWTYSVTENYGQ